MDYFFYFWFIHFILSLIYVVLYMLCSHLYCEYSYSPNEIYLKYENSLRSQTLACNTIYKIKLLDAYQIVKQGIYDHNVQLARSRVL